MIKAIKISKEQFNIIEAEIHNTLKTFDDYNSPTYQSKEIPTTDGKVLLLKPKRQHFVDALDIDWQKIPKSELLIIEE